MPRPSRHLVWTLPAVAAFGGSLLLGGGFVAALSGRLGEPAAELPAARPAPFAAPAAGELLVVALGDSLTRGAGDGRAGGWAERAARSLERPGRPVRVVNAAADGAETADLLRVLEREEVAGAVRRAHLVLLSISGNDLTHSLRRASDPAAASQALGAARANVARALALVRERNATAPIRLLGLYDPSASGGEAGRLVRQALVPWNAALAGAAAEVDGCVFVPAADLFEARPDRVSGDRLHPGPSGHEALAARAVATLPAELARQSAR